LRVRHRPDLIPLLSKKANTWEKVPLEKALRASGAPAGVVRKLPEVFALGTAGNQHTLTNSSGHKRVATVAYHLTFLGKP